MIADDGQAVYQCKGLCIVTGAGAPAPDPFNPTLLDPTLREPVTMRIPTSAEPMEPAISASARTVVYESLFEEGQCRRLFSVDVNSGKETLLFVDGFPDRFVALGRTRMAPMFGATIDDAGRRVLLLVRESEGLPRQWLLTLGADGSDPKWFGYVPEGYREAVLSGDGKTAFAITSSGRIARYDLVSDETVDVLSRVPWISGVSGAPQPGAANRIEGGGLSTVTRAAGAFPAPAELGGYRVEFEGRALPVLEVSPTGVTFQVPWEMDAGVAGSLKLVPPAGEVLRAPPRPYRIPGERVAFPETPLRHSDGRAISPADPARPGEEIRVYATGFATPRGVTGVPPVEPITNRRELVRCFGGDPGTPGPEAVFYGFAEKRVGVYELRLRLPRYEFGSPGVRMQSMFCRVGEGEPQVPIGIEVPVAP